MSELEKFWADLQKKILSNDTKPLLIDVRSESEFAHDGLDFAENYPILTDPERHEVGVTYKLNGPHAAVSRGHELVSGGVRILRVSRWREAYSKGLRYLSCWRGGLRSRIAADWLKEAGAEAQRIEGGTKAIRKKCLEGLGAVSPADFGFVIHGRTGCGKTRLLEQIKTENSFYGLIDLEGFAHHRGSSFGQWLHRPQPTQIQFENRLAISVSAYRSVRRALILEGESKLIGKCAIPLDFFARMQEAAVISLVESLEVRIRLIYEEYIRSPFEQGIPEDRVAEAYLSALNRISKKLGGVKYQQLQEKIKRAFACGDSELHRNWIEELLVTYYDKLYDHSKTLTLPRLVFEGNSNEVKEYLREKAKEGFEAGDKKISA